MSRKPATFPTILFALLLAPAVGAAAVSQPPREASGTGSQELRITDEGIRQAVTEKLGKLDGLDASNLTVAVSGRTVTVQGKLDHLPAGDRVLEAIQAVRGVDNVITSFAVEPQKRSDEAIRQDVRDSLAFDPVTSLATLEVSVENGRVTLDGTVRTWSEKQLAAWLAGDVRGVREIRNRIAVPSSDRTDEELARSIRRRWATDPMVSDDLTVDVRDGKAVLRGEVRSALERRWAVADARALGVSEVDTSGLRVNPDRGGSARAAMTDDEIREAIASGYLHDPRVFSFNPRIEVEQGRVTLSGSVSNLKAKQAAVQLARSTAGVTEVRDHLSVRTDARPADQVAAELRRAFQRSQLVDAPGLTVQVQEGRATLRGTVDSAFEKWAAGDIAARGRGISAVDNQLKVEPAPAEPVAATDSYYYPWHSSPAPWTHTREPRSKSDAELLEDVRSQLFWSPFANAENILVSVKDGTVTLRGEVGSWMARGAAADNAYQAGARRVDNRLSVLQPTGR